MEKKNYYIFLDESGSIHKNSHCKFFAIGGYICEFCDKNRIKQTFKKVNKQIKDNNNIDLNKELKSYDYSVLEKIDIFNAVQDFNTFVGISKIFDKDSMIKDITNVSTFYNYSVKILFCDLIKKYLLDSDVEYNFIISLDSRSTSLAQNEYMQKQLEDYLNTEFCLYNYKFSVKYYDSATNFQIQLADIIVNTIYNSYKDISLVEDIMPVLKPKNFRFSIFPKKISKIS